MLANVGGGLPKADIPISALADKLLPESQDPHVALKLAQFVSYHEKRKGHLSNKDFIPASCLGILADRMVKGSSKETLAEDIGNAVYWLMAIAANNEIPLIKSLDLAWADLKPTLESTTCQQKTSK